MAWLAVLIIVVGALVAFMIVRVPHRVMRLLDEAETRRQRIADLDARLARLSEMRTNARRLFDEAIRRGGSTLQHDEIETLTEMRAECEVLVAGLHEISPILERYLLNHVAVLAFALGGHDGQSSLPEALQLAIKDLDRSQAAEHSAHPVALLERRLATGRGTS
jgi:hypothetical protein